MLPILIPISALLISDALLLVGHGLLLTLLPVSGRDMGFSDIQVALTGSAYFLGFVTGCFLTPHVLKRAGHIRSFAVLSALYAAVTLAFAWSSDFYAWLILRFITGAAISGLYMIIESWLNERTGSNNRGTVLSIYTMLNMLMITVGQQLLNTAGGDPKQLLNLAAIFIILGVIPVSLTLALAPASVQNVKINLKKVWHYSHIGFIGVVVAGLVTGSFWALAPVFASAVGFDDFQLATFLSATVLGAAFFQLPLGRLSDRYDRRLVLMYTALAGCVISLLFMVVSKGSGITGWLATILSFLWGGSSMTLYAICLAHANDNAAASDFVEVGSGMLIMLGLSSAIGAPIASVVMSVMGPEGLYAYMALFLGGFSVITYIRQNTHSLPYSPESAEPFLPVAESTTPFVFEMDPRHEESSEQT